MSGCLRRASENVARRISPFCTAQLAAAEGPTVAPNGGSRIPRSAEHADEPQLGCAGLQVSRSLLRVNSPGIVNLVHVDA